MTAQREQSNYSQTPKLLDDEFSPRGSRSGCCAVLLLREMKKMKVMGRLRRGPH